MNKRIALIFFDVESNGLQGSSGLSFSAIKLECWIEGKKFKINKVGELNEFFKPRETWNSNSSKIHGITENNISEYRKNNRIFKEQEYFDDTFVQKNIQALFHSSELIIAHNINFDMSFMKFAYPKSKQYDTMPALKDRLAIPHPKYGLKMPKLSECAEFYNLEMDSSQLHGSLYDTRILSKVFCEMLKDKELDTMKRIVELIKNKNLTFDNV